MANNLYCEIQSLVDEGKSQDEILYFLFSKKIPITEAMAAIRTLYGISLGEAKRLVATSRHWEGMHRDNQDLHNNLEKISEACEKSGSARWVGVAEKGSRSTKL